MSDISKIGKVVETGVVQQDSSQSGILMTRSRSNTIIVTKPPLKEDKSITSLTPEKMEKDLSKLENGHINKSKISKTIDSLKNWLGSVFAPKGTSSNEQTLLSKVTQSHEQLNKPVKIMATTFSEKIKDIDKVKRPVIEHLTLHRASPCGFLHHRFRYL